MGGQAIERREVMKSLALASVAGQFAGFDRWVFGGIAGHLHPVSQSQKSQRELYRPQFFSPEEYPHIERLAELIIPNDGTPGAREAGVSEFIDFMAANDPEIQFGFRYGLAWIDGHAVRKYGAAFLKLGQETQTNLLEHLAYKDRHREGEEEGRLFFKLVRDYTVMGFYSSRVGMEHLDVPTLQLYEDAPGCPHLDNPEHRDLPAPQV